MTILKEKEAVDYLQRARSCLHPKEDSFPLVQLLSKMLDVEIAYIKKASATPGSNTALICVDASGFPELPSWVGDISRVAGEANMVQAKRALVLTPFIERFENLQSDGLEQEAQRVVNYFCADNVFVAAVNSLSFIQRDFFNKADKNGLRNFPLHFTEGRGYLTYHNEQPSIFNVHDKKIELIKEDYEQQYRYCLIKYIDDIHDKNQFMLFGVLKKDNVGGLRLLNYSRELLRASMLTNVSSSAMRCYYKPCGVSHDFYNLDEPLYESYNRFAQVNELETAIRSFQPSVKKLLLTADMNAISSGELGRFLAVIQEFDKILKSTVQLFEAGINGIPAQPEGFANATLNNFQKATALVDSMQGDAAKVAFRLAWAEGLRDVKSKAQQKSSQIQELKDPNTSIALAQPKKRFRWLTESPWFAR